MFEVGDEVVCVDDSDDFVVIGGERSIVPFCLRKGDIFRVVGVFLAGKLIEGIRFKTDCIQIGVSSPSCEILAAELPGSIPSTDIWTADRFRKVERKRMREELYALIGISLDAMGGARVQELV